MTKTKGSQGNPGARTCRRLIVIALVCALVLVALAAVRVRDSFYNSGTGQLRTKTWYGFLVPSPWGPRRIAILTTEDRVDKTTLSTYLAGRSPAPSDGSHWVWFNANTWDVFGGAYLDGRLPGVLLDPYFQNLLECVRPVLTEEEFGRVLRLSLTEDPELGNKLLRADFLGRVEEEEDLQARRKMVLDKTRSLWPEEFAVDGLKSEEHAGTSKSRGPDD